MCNLGDIFAIYPEISRELFASQDGCEQINLPSDVDWQHKMYLMLLEKQKNLNEAIARDIDCVDIIRRAEKPIFDPNHHTQGLSTTSSSSLNCLSSGFMTKSCSLDLRNNCHRKTKVLWSIDDICKAALILKNPTQKTIFENEHDMKKVYSLLYDVFRYNFILKNTLNDVNYFEQQLKNSYNENMACLMLYDLYEREFCRNSSVYPQQLNILYQKCNIKECADILWTFRAKLAASITRMRIEHGALQLSQLLPPHLRDEKVKEAAVSPIVTGWINPFLIRDKNSAESLLLQYGLTPRETNAKLDRNQYKWDNVCPLFLSFMPADRRKFADSEFVVKRYFIIQDRSFAVGPAIMARLLNLFDLNGDIVQTNVNSPRSTAYLASLFYSVNEINKFYVYGLGSNLQSFRNYMEDLSIGNINIFAEPFASFPPDSSHFRKVVGIFANPANSLSALSDPVDFICSRGGDLEMLKLLTEPFVSQDGRNRARMILNEQLLTLKMAMSRPQVQFILYKTHSLVRIENQDMVEHSIKTFNEAALRKHRLAFYEKMRLEELEREEPAIKSSAGNNSNSKIDLNSGAEYRRIGEKGKVFRDYEVKLPEIDEFECVAIPDICKNQDRCIQTRDNGCFLSLIRRKKITRLNAKFLILTAEKRGLFGKAEVGETIKSKPAKAPEEKSLQQITKGADVENMKTLTSQKHISVTRLQTCTEASIYRSNLDKYSKQKSPIRFNYKNRTCFRQRHHFGKNPKYLWMITFKLFRSKNGGIMSSKQMRRTYRTTSWKRLRFPVHFLNIYF